MDYKNIISKRKSVRDYKKISVSDKIFDELKVYYKNQKKLIDGIDIEIILKNKDEIFDKLKGSAGYKENMIEAPNYMLVFSDEKQNYLENAAYVVENVLLKAYDMGVGSCWITFNNGDLIKEKLSINSDKKLAGLIAMGYDDNKSKIVNEPKWGDNPSKADIKFVKDNTSNRLSLEDIVFLRKWGNKADALEIENRGLFNALNCARFAPSTLNRQPWRFILDDDVVVLTLRADINIDNYNSKIDTGIVMLYFDLVVDNSMFDTKWNLGKPINDYNIPDDFTIVGYCNI